MDRLQNEINKLLNKGYSASKIAKTLHKRKQDILDYFFVNILRFFVNIVNIVHNLPPSYASFSILYISRMALLLPWTKSLKLCIAVL